MIKTDDIIKVGVRIHTIAREEEVSHTGHILDIPCDR